MAAQRSPKKNGRIDDKQLELEIKNQSKLGEHTRSERAKNAWSIVVCSFVYSVPVLAVALIIYMLVKGETATLIDWGKLAIGWIGGSIATELRRIGIHPKENG